VTRTYASPEAARLTGASYRQLDYWDRIGLLQPSAQQSAGSGSQRRYSTADVVKLGAIVRLLRCGLSLACIGEALSDPRPVEALLGIAREIERLGIELEPVA
jgi:DNA-binding transcriptional MerR regulator